MTIENIKKIAVIGAGNMGHQIATHCAMSGYETWCTDASEEQLAKAKAFVESYLPGRVAKGRITQEQADKAASLINFTPDLETAVKDVDVVIEAIVENTDIKCDLFRKLDALCKPETIFATNSSTFPSSRFVDCVKDPSRLVNMHFFNPALVMKCVEIMRGPHTSDETFQAIVDLTVKLGKTPTRINREIESMVVNRILGKIYDEAFFLYESGYASIEDIDNAVTGALGHPMGPFTLMDLTGIDLGYRIRMEKFKKSGNKADLPWPIQVEKFLNHEWGRKTGKGFYDYTEKK